MSSDNNTSLKQDGFNSQIGFIIACVGSAVGMGNLWRFPVLVSAWGGMTFLIPYFIFVILIGSTGVVEEIALGRSTGKGPIGAFGAAMAFTGQLFAMGQDMKTIGDTFGSTTVAFGNNTWIIIALIVNFAIMAFGVADGIEKANKFMMPLLFVMMIGLAVYIGVQPGAADGYKYIFTVNLAVLKDIRLWIFAFGQAFFSLSIAGNGTVIYGSYLSKKEDVPFSAMNIAVFDTVAALLAALVIIPAMATSGAELSAGGPGLMFIYLVNIMNKMPGGMIVGIIFFVCVTFAGLSSLVNLYEAPVATLQQQFRLSRIQSVGVIGVLGIVVAVLIQGIVEGWMDAVSIYICPIGAVLASVMLFFMFGKKYTMEAVNTGAKKPKGDTWFFLGKYVYTGLALLALIAGAIYGGIG